LVAQAFLELPSLGRAVGVELAPSRHKVALQAWASASASLRAAGQASTLVGVQSGAFGGLADESGASVESTSGELMLAELCAPVDGQAQTPEFFEASFLEVRHWKPVLV
jgi:sigma54-dependent transcription regulator